MPEIEKLFMRNVLEGLNKNEDSQTSNYLELVRALARITNLSIFIIDYHKKGFEYVSENPMFLCGHSAKEIMEMGFSFYSRYLTKNDLDLLFKINTIGFDFYDRIPIEERKDYSLSYDIHIKNQEATHLLINQKVTPIYLTETGKIWKAMSVVSLSSKRNAGNIKIYNDKTNEVIKYNLQNGNWKTEAKIKLSIREKQILQLSAKGYAINQIAEAIYLSRDTIKFHRRNLFDKLKVQNISEAIVYASNNRLLYSVLFLHAMSHFLGT